MLHFPSQVVQVLVVKPITFSTYIFPPLASILDTVEMREVD
jgi:hypothetical protein